MSGDSPGDGVRRRPAQQAIPGVHVRVTPGYVGVEDDADRDLHPITGWTHSGVLRVMCAKYSRSRRRRRSELNTCFATGTVLELHVRERADMMKSSTDCELPSRGPSAATRFSFSSRTCNQSCSSRSTETV